MAMSFLDVKRADRNYWYLFGDLYNLMSNAGSAVAKVTTELYGKNNSILVICGRGNNGGDGLVAAAALSSQNKVTVCVLGGIENMKTSESRRAARKYKGEIIAESDLASGIRNSTIIIDAMLGSGVTGKPREPFSQVVHEINISGKKIVSVDVPTGMQWEEPVRPEVTVTFTDIKEGMTQQNSGNIVVRDIGIPDKVFKYNGPGDFAYYRIPGKETHKGMNGNVGLIAGWTYYGSAVISGKAAVKAGADLVRIFAEEEKVQTLSSYGPDLIVKSATKENLSELQSNHSLVIGPGLGQDQDLSAVMDALKDYKGTIVLDAEGLSKLDTVRENCPEAEIIITPHKGEFRNLSGEDPVLESAVRFAADHKCTVLLKGSTDIVTDGNRTRYTEGGNPRMTMGGTGDLLAGITASVSTRVDDPFQAACLSSFISKRTGELMFRQRSYWYDIKEMIEMIPEVMKLALWSQ